MSTWTTLFVGGPVSGKRLDRDDAVEIIIPVVLPSNTRAYGPDDVALVRDELTGEWKSAFPPDLSQERYRRTEVWLHESLW